MANLSRKTGKIPAYSKLNPTADQISEAKTVLKKFYTDHPDRLEVKGNEVLSIDDKIEEVVQKAINGYPYCPKNFIKRVKSVARITSSVESNKKTNYYDVREERLNEALKEREKEIYPGFSGKELRTLLEPEERRRWVERERYYRMEFDFNNSVDQVLLTQVLTEEITQFRLVKKRLSGDNTMELDVQLDSSYKRLERALKLLGITREQREAAGAETEGNIAQLSAKLDEKLAKIEAIKEKDKIIEDAMVANRKSDDVIRQLPEDLREVARRAMQTDDY